MGRLKAPPGRLTAPPRAVGFADRAEAERARDAIRRANADESLRNLYMSKRWRDPETGVRVRIIARDGSTCQMCGQLTLGKHPAPNSPVVDHITPHKGNLALFWDEANLQCLCARCHNGRKQRLERAAEGQGGG